MPVTINTLKSKRNLIFVSLMWILLWVVPWGTTLPVQTNIYLAFLIDLIRLTIAMGLFVVPGSLLYLLINKSDDRAPNLLEIIVVGFAFSVLMIALIGLLGRVAGLSFLTVKILFTMVGLVELVLIAYQPNRNTGRETTDSFRSDLMNPPLILAIVIATLITWNGYLFFYDDTTYLAYLTNWQFSDQLGFKNIVFEGDFTEAARFWLAMYPMGQALLSSISGVPGLLLLSNHLELLLVPGAVLTSYWFGQSLGLSRKAAGFAALIQVSLFCWMIWNAWPVGTWFYQSMSEDKVSAVFLLSPVFFVFVLRFIQSPIRNNLLLVLLSGLSLTLTHPVILFFTCSIAFTMGGISWILNKVSWHVIAQLIVIFAGLILPYVFIRFSGEPTQARIPYDAESASQTFQIERYNRTIGDVFYGLNPELLKFMDMDLQPGSRGYVAFQLFRMIPVLLMIVAGIWSMMNLRKGALYWYILASSLLIFIATFPYTGWLLGYAVSARMISRSAWFSPLGLSGILISMLTVDWLKSIKVVDAHGRVTAFKSLRLNIETIGLVACFMFVAPLLLQSLVFQVPLFFKNLDHSRQLAEVGEFIDQSAVKPVTVLALDYDDTQLLPGVSTHASLISFREERDYNPHNYFFSIEESRKRIEASKTIRSLDRSVPAEKRCLLFDKYDVRYIIAEPETVELFLSLTDTCERKWVHAFKAKDLILLEYK